MNLSHWNDREWSIAEELTEETTPTPTPITNNFSPIVSGYCKAIDEVSQVPFADPRNTRPALTPLDAAKLAPAKGFWRSKCQSKGSKASHPGEMKQETGTSPVTVIEGLDQASLDFSQAFKLDLTSEHPCLVQLSHTILSQMTNELRGRKRRRPARHHHLGQPL